MIDRMDSGRPKHNNDNRSNLNRENMELGRGIDKRRKGKK